MVIFLPPNFCNGTGSALFYKVPLLVRIRRKSEPSRYLNQKAPSFQVTGDTLVLSTFSPKYH